MKSRKTPFFAPLLGLLTLAGSGCSSESGDPSVSSGQQVNAYQESHVIEKIDPSDIVEPTFTVDAGHLSINGVSFVLNETSVESLAEILGPWEATFSNGAYTNYAWESLGLFAQVGFTERVQHLHLLPDPTSTKETWEMSFSPFSGMVVVDGYLMSQEVTVAEWKAVLDYEVSESTIDYDIRTRPCSITVFPSASSSGLKRILMSGR